MSEKRRKRNLRIIRYILYKETQLDFKDKTWSFIGSFVGIGFIAYLQAIFLEEADNIFLIGSFGASSVLVFGAVASPLAQPRNLIGGHLISAFIGVSIYFLIPDPIFISAPLAVSLSIVTMQFTKTLHPPGGATALIAVIGSESIKGLGYWFLVFPVLSGTLILFLFALLTNNLTKKRQYPNSKRFHRFIKR
ncbi:HPP family protein [Flexithrix dorotheae]|uniref:HPP family protein n=1 Tax=Flexithrix dorotheae TaxID=70993 RepID=UPI00036D9D3F|nr:HPP family protein [Flexithrix dorotheae]